MQKDPNLSQMPPMLTLQAVQIDTENGNSAGAGYFTKPYVEESLLDGAQRMLCEVLVAERALFELGVLCL